MRALQEVAVGDRAGELQQGPFEALDLDLVPGTGLLAATVPGAFDGWLTMLDEWGTWSLADVLHYAIHYASTGFPATPTIVRVPSVS